MANFPWKQFYLLDRGGLSAILAPDSDELIKPQPFVLRAFYIGIDNLEQDLPRARARLIEPNCPLLVVIVCPDGPPQRSGVYFTCDGAGKTSRLGASVRQYSVLTSSGPSALVDKRQGRLGFIVTGNAGDDSLWRVTRLETDAFDRNVFTLAPVRMAGNLPSPDFSALTDALLVAELTQQYQDLCRSAIQHGYRDVVTKGRNIVECLVAARLRSQDQPASGKLYDDLILVRKLLDGPTRDTCGWLDLDYHLCHKIRLLHGRTHVNQVAQTGPLRPEFALAVIEDLTYLLAAWGYLR